MRVIAHKSPRRRIAGTFKMRSGRLDPKDFSACVSLLSEGKVAVFPTDTVYGLGCNAFHVSAVHEVYRLKGRSYKKPLPLLLGDVTQLPLVAAEVLPAAQKLIDCFWPGSLTLVFKTAPLALAATRGKSTVAVRLPRHGLVRDLSNALGVPLAATSANPSGKPPAVTFQAAKSYFGKTRLALIDGGPCDVSIASTVLDVTHEPFTVIREGALSRQVLMDVLSNKS